MEMDVVVAEFETNGQSMETRMTWVPVRCLILAAGDIVHQLLGKPGWSA